MVNVSVWKYRHMSFTKLFHRFGHQSPCLSRIDGAGAGMSRRGSYFRSQQKRIAQSANIYCFQTQFTSDSPSEILSVGAVTDQDRTKLLKMVVIVAWCRNFLGILRYNAVRTIAFLSWMPTEWLFINEYNVRYTSPGVFSNSGLIAKS